MRVKKSLTPGRSAFFDNVFSISVYWSPFHSSGLVAREFINRFHGPKFRRNNSDVVAEHHMWDDYDQPALFKLHIDDGSKEGYKFEAVVPDGFTFQEFEELLMRERRIIETDNFREEVWAGSQKPQDEEDEDGGYVPPVKTPVGLNVDYFAYGPKGNKE